jgi:GH43 family beta-xylosidase
MNYIQCVGFVGAFLLLAMVCSKPVQAEEFTNPLIEQRADPFIYKHTDGYYYFSATVPEYDRLELRRAETIQGLTTAEAKVIWRKRDTGIMGSHIWAPELHYIDGKWYIYFAAGGAERVWDIRTYVLECADENPLTGTWTEKGQVVTGDDKFVLDATTFEHNGTRYLVWSDDGPLTTKDNSLYIATLSDPWTLSSEKVMISTPNHAWEKCGFWVNEGPAVLKRNGKIFISYSASATDHYYCMGLLTADENSNLLDPASWTKSEEPVFKTSEETGQYGPGHNSFTVSKDGSQDILVYHARTYKKINGDPLHDSNRHTRVQAFGWNDDGTPDFGEPVPDGQTH